MLRTSVTLANDFGLCPSWGAAPNTSGSSRWGEAATAHQTAKPYPGTRSLFAKGLGVKLKRGLQGEEIVQDFTPVRVRVVEKFRMKLHPEERSLSVLHCLNRTG